MLFRSDGTEQRQLRVSCRKAQLLALHHGLSAALARQLKTLRGRLAASELELLSAGAREAEAAWSAERSEEALIGVATRLATVRGSATAARSRSSATR